MRSQLYTWVILALCLAAVLGAMGWISLTLLRLDAEETDARREAARQEHIRLAMWRLETRACDHVQSQLRATQPPAERPETADAAAPWWPRFALESPHPDAHGQVAQTRGNPEQLVRNKLEDQARRAYVRDRLVAVAAWEPPTDAGVVTLRLVDGRRVPMAELPTLTDTLDDLLPDAELQLIDPAKPGPEGLTLYALPYQLLPGEPAFFYQRPFSPIRLMLLIAWSCILLPSVGVVLLLFVMASLSERRAAFVSAVTHELRTPLTTFRMYTDMMADGMVPPERQTVYLQTLQREAARLSHLVDNVLTYARLERGRAREALTDLRLSSLIDRCHDELRTRAERADMQLIIDIPDDLAGIAVTVDAAAVERILANLVDNACKYAGEAEDRRIVLSAVRDADYLDIQVRDFGPGLPSDARRVFTPFAKLRDSDQQKPGIGLGLALCRKLALRMNGDLGHEAADPGVTFILAVPIASESGD